MADSKPKFDDTTLRLLESLKGRRKPAKRAPRAEGVAKGGAAGVPGAPGVKGKVVVRRSAMR